MTASPTPNADGETTQTIPTKTCSYSPLDQAPMFTNSQNDYGSVTLDVDRDSQAASHKGSTGSIMGQDQPQSTVSFHDINYTVQVPTRPCCGPKIEKQILKNINGIFKQGMNAIMGPTGSGKTSLLDVLAGRKDPSGLKGDVLVDGHSQPENFKCMAGYVVQQDILMGTLTVRENLLFSANLRLAGNLTNKEKAGRVQDVIEELGLMKCADTKIGTEFIRGISGGEKKRTNIGVEMITNPKVLFLDEPTTGLDASTANSVMKLLRALSRRGRTVIFSIHQPRFSIYKQFDVLLLLSQGELVYQGPSSEAVDYFKTLHYTIEAQNNPPDFFLDVINGDCETDESGKEDNQQDDAVNNDASKEVGLNDSANGGGFYHPEITIIDPKKNPIADDNETNSKSYLAESYRSSSWFEKIKTEIDPILEAHKSHVTDGSEVPYKGLSYAKPFYVQFAKVARRAALNLIRNPQASVFQVIVMIVFGLVVGAIYWQMDTSLKSGVQNRVGVFFFIVMNMVFGNLSATELFIRERALFIHENVSGFYRVSAYFLGKIFCDILPTRCIPLLFFAPITYFMTGLTLEVHKFFIYLLNLILTTLAACGIAFSLSATFDIVGIANLFISLIYVLMMVFSGLLVNLDTVVVWLRWIKYLSIFRYSVVTLSINELKDMEFCGKINGTEICQPAGDQYLKAQGIEFETDWDLWVNEMALGCIALIGFIICYIQLRRVNKLK